MERAFSITAVSGWAISPEWFRHQITSAFPHSPVQVIYPEQPKDPAEASCLIESHQADLWLGYSLGSLWLMHHLAIFDPAPKLAFLAPVFGFTQEQELGGKTRKVQLDYLIKMLRREPSITGIVSEFHSSIGIKDNLIHLESRFNSEILINGLKFLKNTTVNPKSVESSLLICGENDPLLDSSIISGFLPRLEIIKSAGHHPGPLLKAMADTVFRKENIDR